MKGYRSVKETAEKWGVSVRWVNQYAVEGRIPGCERLGRAWVIPEDAKKPERLKPGAKGKPNQGSQKGQS
ncbi:MAG: helix-turn-helix domain-containing protein [Clostridia bacterium]|nr:helix-turn-helix domain-containing protein [Clostridia bacterium]